MINVRGAPKKKFEKPQKSRPTITSRGKANCSPVESDRSLLVHDDRTELLSDKSFSLKEIHDKDIPLEKRNIINDPGYFKQLSLSFYGNSPSPNRSLTKLDNKDNKPNNTKKVPKKIDTSLSPRSRTEYYYGLRKSPTAQFEKDPFQINISSLARKGQTQNSLSSSRLNVSQTKDNPDVKSPRSIGCIELKTLKTCKTSLKNVLMTQVKRNESKGTPSQLTTGNTTCSTATPRYTNFWDKELIKDIHRLSPKKVSKTKTKAVTKEYLITEPNTSGMKNSNSSTTILKKSNSKGDGNNILNFKVVMGADGQIQSHRAVAPEKAATRTSLSKRLQGLSNNKGTGIAIGLGLNPKSAKNSCYYNS